jgi:cytidyltransferase-like protein
LTQTHLEPSTAAIQALWYAARAAVDPALRAARPDKGGKPYPLGQCLEITQAVQRQARAWLEAATVPELGDAAAVGLAHLRTFLTAGGELRLVWGVLREQYFQNALQLGAWYVDVANDTVDPAKPPVDILPFAESGLVAVADFAHFARIARAYWGAAIYPNHLFPALAPWLPLLSDVAGTGLRLQVGNDYMIALSRQGGFEPARLALAAGQVPDPVIRRVAAVLAPGELGFTLQAGRAQALAACEQARADHEPEASRRRDQAVAQLLAINHRLAQRPGSPVKSAALRPPQPGPLSPADLLRQATERLKQDPIQATDAFAAALDPATPHRPRPTPLERVRLGLCLGLAWMQRNRVQDSLAVTESALRLAATLPWPPTATPRATAFDAVTAAHQLEALLAALCQAGVPAVAAGGTLLGLVREGRLLAHDKDIDVIVPIEAFARACTFVVTQGWQPAWIPIPACNFRAFVHRQSGLTLDLFGYAIDHDQQRMLGGWWPPERPASDGRLLMFSPFSRVQRASPAGPLWAIAQPERYLAEMYGPNWRTPDPDYEPLLSTPALVGFNAYTRALSYLRLLEAWSGGRRERVRRLLAAIGQRAPEDPVRAVFAPAKTAPVFTSDTASPVIGGALGVFDLLHVGHLRFLRAARAGCDWLKVGVCTERTAWNSKQRLPVLALERRLEMLSELRCVDEVVPFAGALAETQAAADWIQAWGVQRLFVSQDWAGSQRWRALEPELRTRGIICLWLPATPDISTSAIRARVSQAVDDF